MDILGEVTAGVFFGLLLYKWLCEPWFWRRDVARIAAGIIMAREQPEQTYVKEDLRNGRI
jgi:hypothetical protein